ncbi:hypothetical protein [Tepidimicrobium xylanilyticum]
MGKYINFTLIKERDNKKTVEQNTVKAIAELNIEDKKKDILIQNMAQTIASLNIEITKLKGADE